MSDGLDAEARQPEPVVLSETGEPLYQLVTRRDYIETLDQLLDSIDLDIAVVNRIGKVIVWNEHLARSWCSKERAIGADIRDLMPQLMEVYRGYRIAEALLEDVVGEGKTIAIPRYPLRRRSGALAVLDFKAYPLRGRGAAILGAVLVMADVSEKVELEQQLIRSARTTSLARLGASMAHEIRNPLSSLQLNIELIQEGLQGDTVDREGLLETTGVVLEEARRLNELVTHFMEFARPAPPSFELVPLSEPVMVALRLLAEDAKRAGVQVEVELPDDLPPCRLDRRQIQQVVYNIALNALQMMEGGGALHVKAWSHPDHVAVRIRDTGPGIPPDALESLFDLFFSTREGGTGLGLPIAQRIVESHGGKLTAENAEDGGAVFTIYLLRERPVDDA